MCIRDRFYENEGPVIFPSDDSIKGMLDSLRHWFVSRYESSVLREKIQLALNVSNEEERTLDESTCRLLIPAYNRNSDTEYLFRTSHRRDGNPDSEDAVLAALSTTAAPTYFESVDVDSGIKAIDGGIWANNPSMIAIAEATDVLEVDISRIELLSIGTTHNTEILSNPLSLDNPIINKLLESAIPGFIGKLLMKTTVRPRIKKKELDGRIGWVVNIADLFMKTQAQATDYECRKLLAERYLRIDPPSNATGLADVKAMPKLQGLAEHIAVEYFEKVKTRFLNGLKVDDWNPARRN